MSKPSTIEAPLLAAARTASIAGVCCGLFASYTVADLAQRRLLRREPSPSPLGVRDRHVRLWARAQRRLLGVRVLRAPGPGGDGLPPWQHLPQGPRLVVSNHRSALDIVVLLELFGGSLLSRGDINQWPALGALARAAGTLFVDRDEAQSRITAIRLVRSRLLSGGTVVVFPEGTTFPGDQVRPFHPGSFMGITGGHGHAAGCVVPVGLAYASEDALFGDETFAAHLSRLLGLRETLMAVAVGAPLQAKGLGAKEIAARAQASVQELVGQARALLRREQQLLG